RRLPELGAARILLHDEAGLLLPHRASELVGELREVAGLPVGLYSQGAAGNALAVALEAARAGADLVACAVYPIALTVHQVGAEAAGDRLDEVLDEVDRVRREAGSPPLSAPIGQIIGTQALLNVLGANRYGTMVDELRDLVAGAFGRTPGPIDDGLARAVELY